MTAFLKQVTMKELQFLIVQLITTQILQEGHQYVTLLPFAAIMFFIQRLNKLGFLIGQVQGVVQQQYSASLPQSIQNIVFGSCCQIQATRDYVPRNLQGYGWVYLAGYVCYLTLGLLSLGMFMSQHDIPYTALELQYLGAIQVASVLMANGLSSSWVQWLGVCIIGILHSWQFVPILAICAYGFANWNRNL